MISRKQSAAAKNSKVRVAKLNKEAFKVVNEKAFEIAKALFESTIKGHVLSARLLVELAEGDVDVEAALLIRPLRSLAQRLAAEPQWPSDAPDEWAETEDEETSAVVA
jgi:hypothetical protein